MQLQSLKLFYSNKFCSCYQLQALYQSSRYSQFPDENETPSTSFRCLKGWTKMDHESGPSEPSFVFLRKPQDKLLCSWTIGTSNYDLLQAAKCRRRKSSYMSVQDLFDNRINCWRDIEITYNKEESLRFCIEYKANASKRKRPDYRWNFYRIALFINLMIRTTNG